MNLLARGHFHALLTSIHPLSEFHGISGIPLMNLAVCEIRSVLLRRLLEWKMEPYNNAMSLGFKSTIQPCVTCSKLTN
jgi:hypothetical protein